MRSVFVTALLFLSSFAMAVGCGSGDTAEDMIRASNRNNIQRLANLYQMHQFSRQGMGPESVDAFKEFLRNAPVAKLNKMGVDTNEIDELFISERDGEEFDFRFGVPGGMGSVEPVVFERTGVDGVRMVGFTSMYPQEVTEQSEYDDLLAGKFKKSRGRQTSPPSNKN